MKRHLRRYPTGPLADAYNAGLCAAFDGVRRHRNPHSRGSQKHHAWWAGHSSGTYRDRYLRRIERRLGNYGAWPR